MPVASANQQPRGHYRWRTSLRGRLPWALTRFVPKGCADCGAHEWYRQDQFLDRCYHCEPGVRLHRPLTSRPSPETRAELQRSVEAGGQAAAELLATLEPKPSERVLELLELINVAPEMTASEIADVMEIDVDIAEAAIRRLLDAGILERDAQSLRMSAAMWPAANDR